MAAANTCSPRTAAQCNLRLSAPSPNFCQCGIGGATSKYLVGSPCSLGSSCEMGVREQHWAGAGSKNHQDLWFFFSKDSLHQQHAHKEGLATGRSHDPRTKNYLLPGNRCCLGLTVLAGLLLCPHVPALLRRSSFQGHMRL